MPTLPLLFVKFAMNIDGDPVQKFQMYFLNYKSMIMLHHWSVSTDR